MKILKLKLDQIKCAEWNPERRSEPGYCEDLIASITRTGRQLIPGIVTKNKDGSYTIVEGHRRATACAALGRDFEAVECAPNEAALVYAEVNSAVKRLDGKSKLYVYLKNPDALDSATRKECERWSAETCQFMYDHGAGVATFKQARTVANYAGTDIEDTAKWLAKHNLTYAIRRALEDGIPESILAAAIKGDKGIRHTWAAA